MNAKDIRALIIGAHPDDPDIYAGCLALLLAREGAKVQMVSLTNGDKGHQRLAPRELAARRRDETGQAAKAFGIDSYIVCDTPDCELEPTIALRKEVTRLIRRFAPHIVVTHRLCDYHADHRAAARLVLDAAYLLGVPSWCPDTPVPPVAPAIFHMRDNFMASNPFRADVLVPCDDAMPQFLSALDEHASQFFEWLPFDMKIEDRVPPLDDPAARRRFINEVWIVPRKCRDADRYRAKLRAALGAAADAVRYAEPFELSEYGASPDAAALRGLFPFLAEGLVTPIR